MFTGSYFDAKNTAHAMPIVEFCELVKRFAVITEGLVH
jgi:hypothetical protein